ncbi:hypothetical protein EDD37DRAFT_46347 [Exophiala viscosa]|uniref:Zn(2)-C6 fungal-type domain-containing protein n=1 Tax=Exophiala viscosa TaxID=2486360 RepID=A0AAN6E2V7_9EURO|nr:hypothetical protein EDD36DRAFT_154939 [Exophiala viscosa]KAI1629311.1 hypothetical protein EDD37DRAFT_46347 [Exophiala viscosa]
MSNRRSRFGCWRCRKASRKCDERRPVCNRCSRLSIQCEYRPRLVWTEPKRSISGTVVAGSPQNNIAGRKTSNSSREPETQLGKTGGRTPKSPSQTNEEMSPEEMLSRYSSETMLRSTSPCREICNFHDSETEQMPYQIEDAVSSSAGSMRTASTLSLGPNLSSWKTVVQLDADDLFTFHEFLNHGQRGLHFSSLPNNPLIDDLLLMCQRSLAATATVLSFQACQYNDQKSLVKFDKAVSLYREALPWEDADCTSMMGALICSAAMHLGYSWTRYLSDLLRLIGRAGFTTRRHGYQNASPVVARDHGL